MAHGYALYIFIKDLLFQVFMRNLMRDVFIGVPSHA
jgi:hypothetical protein